MRMRYSIITINYNNSEGLKRTINYKSDFQGLRVYHY